MRHHAWERMGRACGAHLPDRVSTYAPPRLARHALRHARAKQKGGPMPALRHPPAPSVS